MKKSLKVLALTMLFTCSAAFFAYADEIQAPERLIKAGNRVAFMDTYEFMEGGYTTLGLVSMNLDGSDKKLLIPSNNGENNVEDELIAVGDWIYFRYNYDNIARIKNDGSGLEILYQGNDSTYMSRADSNYMYFFEGAATNTQLYRINLANNAVEPLDTSALPKFSPNQIDGFQYVYDLEEQIIVKEAGDGTQTKSAKIQVYPSRDIDWVTVDGIVDGKAILTIKKKDYYTGLRSGNSDLYIRVAADMDTGKTLVLPRVELMSEKWVYYKKEDGLYRMNMSGTEEKVADGKIRSTLAVYDGYVYYVDNEFVTRVYKEQ